MQATFVAINKNIYVAAITKYPRASKRPDQLHWNAALQDARRYQFKAGTNGNFNALIYNNCSQIHTLKYMMFLHILIPLCALKGLPCHRFSS